MNRTLLPLLHFTSYQTALSAEGQGSSAAADIGEGANAADFVGRGRDRTLRAQHDKKVERTVMNRRAFSLVALVAAWLVACSQASDAAIGGDESADTLATSAPALETIQLGANSTWTIRRGDNQRLRLQFVARGAVSIEIHGEPHTYRDRAIINPDVIQTMLLNPDARGPWLTSTSEYPTPGDPGHVVETFRLPQANVYQLQIKNVTHSPFTVQLGLRCADVDGCAVSCAMEGSICPDGTTCSAGLCVLPGR